MPAPRTAPTHALGVASPFPMSVGTRSQHAALVMSTPGLVGYWRMQELSASVAAKNELGMGVATLTGAPLREQATLVSGGAAMTFNGSSQAASAPCTLKPYSRASISFWLNYTGAKANGHFIFEYCNSFDGFNNADHLGGFGIQTNDATTMSSGMGGGTGSFWYDKFPYPSAGWHHWLCTYDRIAKVNQVYIDGVTQTLTTVAHALTTSTFSNDTLYFMARNNASLWGAGQLADVALFGGVLLTQDHALALYNTGLAL